MNRIYRSIWNTALGAWVAAPETARTGRSGARSQAPAAPVAFATQITGRMRHIALAVAMLCTAGLGSPSAWAAEQFWDGSQTTADGAIAGGSGTWNAGSTNWTSLDGFVNSFWGGGAAVFQDTAGTVTVEGVQTITGMQFTTNGYSLQSGVGGSLNLVNDPSGRAQIKVGLGVTATVGVDIHGNGVLEKRDAGTLVLNGSNSYTGDTQLEGGTLVVGSNTALSTGDLSVANGTVLDSNTAVTLANKVVLNAASLTNTGSHDLTLAGEIRGIGALIKNGSGTLTLNGVNSYSSGTTLNAGTLILGHSKGMGSGTLTVGGISNLDNSTALTADNNVVLNADLTIDGSNALTLAGVVSGGGGLIKNGSGTLTLTGSNTYSGNTMVNAGTFRVDGSLNSASVQVNSGGTLTGNGSLTGAVTVADGAHLTGTTGKTLSVDSLVFHANSNFDVSLGAPVSGGGNALVDVNGNLTLNGTLNIRDIGGFGSGVYRLINYSGGLTDNGMVLGMLPGNVTPGDLTLQTALANQINLINTQGMTLNFWNANGLASNTALGGGSGIWNNTATVWTDVTGSVTAAMSPQPGFAIFGGAAGTVTVDNTTGPVQATGLQFASDGYSLDGGALTLVGPVEIRVGDGSASSSGWTATLNNEIAGSDGLEKTDAGRLVLNGANTYSGGTTVAAGTLSVSQDANLGAAGSDVTLDGGSLQVTGTAFTSNGGRNWALGSTGGGIDIADAGNRFTLASALAGSGSLTKTGAGTLTLTGANTYSGGTTIDGGTLVASVANLGSGAITNNAALELHQTVDASLTQDISGSGSFTKTGSGTLTLMGRNTSTGATTIDAGGLVASVANLGSGAITNNAALELRQTVDASLTQAISGSGSLSKTGAGALTLLGDSSGYTGSTLISKGSLLLASTGQLGGGVTVASGATLAGTGTVGGAGRTTTVQSGAVITTGDASSAYGSLQVAGDLVLEQGSSYQVRVDPNSADSSRIHVTGSATLAGSVLHVGNEHNASTDFQVGKTYTILAASQISGKFSEATTSYAYLDAALGYTRTDVTLQLQRKSNGGSTIGFADLAGTSNQASVAHGIESLPSNHALYQHIETLPAGTPEAVLASLSGDTHASVAGSLVSLGARAPSISSQHLYSNLTAGMRSGAPVAQSSGTLPASAWPSSKALPAWAEVVGHWQTYNGDGNAARLKQNTAGLFVGMDQEVAGSGWRLGGSLGYTHADGRVADRDSTSKVNSYSAAVYGGKSFGSGVGPRINVLGGLAYSWHDIRTERHVASLGQTLKADYSAHTAQLFAEVGYAIGQYDKFGFEPFVGVSLGQQRTGSFQERGGFAALQGHSHTDDLASTTLGLRMHSDFELAGKESRLRATVGWRHAFGDVKPQKTMAFEGGQNFTVAGSPLARNTALLGLEAEMALSRSAALVLGYRGEVGSGTRDHAASVKLRWAF